MESLPVGTEGSLEWKARQPETEARVCQRQTGARFPAGTPKTVRVRESGSERMRVQRCELNSCSGLLPFITFAYAFRFSCFK